MAMMARSSDVMLESGIGLAGAGSSDAAPTAGLEAAKRRAHAMDRFDCLRGPASPVQGQGEGSLYSASRSGSSMTTWQAALSRRTARS